jgi:hypothetical protein
VLVNACILLLPLLLGLLLLLPVLLLGRRGWGWLLLKCLKLLSGSDSGSSSTVVTLPVHRAGLTCGGRLISQPWHLHAHDMCDTFVKITMQKTLKYRLLWPHNTKVDSKLPQASCHAAAACSPERG